MMVRDCGDGDGGLMHITHLPTHLDFCLNTSTSDSDLSTHYEHMRHGIHDIHDTWRSSSGLYVSLYSISVKYVSTTVQAAAQYIWYTPDGMAIWHFISIRFDSIRSFQFIHASRQINRLKKIMSNAHARSEFANDSFNARIVARMLELLIHTSPPPSGSVNHLSFAPCFPSILNISQCEEKHKDQIRPCQMRNYRIHTPSSNCALSDFYLSIHPSIHPCLECSCSCSCSCYIIFQSNNNDNDDNDNDDNDDNSTQHNPQ
ncbi:hypothetical protein P154DRAFT_269063 [Amniculicola lignicola CBS 123094]|uniref:Uncharacterized protein n=1 Tax=Amniculicola lignicola CBS 123094 TaxID=1392246 RepID=A0A6A5W9S4_9PLEO|nr:hypothetical protein P154DRAFT_269063 [Amniculicola lignicola CBS 123094]